MLAYLDCFSGVSGDMLLGALLDAGADPDALRSALASLPLTGYRLEIARIADSGLRGTRIVVQVDAEQHAHRRLADVVALLAAADLPERARERALGVFRRLAEAEGAIHGASPEEVTFHEVGAIDSIVDIVGVAVCLDLLAIDELYCSPLPLTSGRVKSAHGALPVPAPATLELLRETGATWEPVATTGELVTPTGAAVLATLARFERPTQLRLRQVGYGFGTRKLPWANCLRVLVGDVAAQAASAPVGSQFERDEICVLESNIDNMTGEALGWLMERLLAAGALDVTYTPIQMKKQRPGTQLTILAAPVDAERLAGVALEQSGTLGIRMRRVERLKAGRREEQIETPLGPVRVKLKLIGGTPVSVAPEYDDCRALAEQHGLSLEVVMGRVTAAARRHFGLGDA